ncbi:MAG: toprim domain-containing protein [Alphaproteobacteria bacterium]|nr:toprim domain-containing protein [Alphaproteobacteria bacterium]
MNNTSTSQEKHLYCNNNLSSLELLYDALDINGIPTPRHVRSSRFTRWGKNQRYWATPCNDGYCFGDFATGFHQSVFPKKRYSKLDWKESQKLKRWEMEKAKALAEQQLREEKAAELASEIWKEAKNCENHPYLQKKNVKSYGLKLTHDGRLIIPAYSCDNKISTLQFINLDGEKKFLKNGRKQGCFFPIGVPSIRILLCEGYATGCSIYEATKELTICCFDAGNLIHVARKFRECYPEKEIIICADNDSGKEKNTGVEKAKEAGREIGAAVVFPVFKDETASPTDFNDLQNLEGIETVRKQIEQAFSKGGSNDGNAS